MIRVRVQIPYLPERGELLEQVTGAYLEQEGVRVDVAAISGVSWGEGQNRLLAECPPGVDYVLTGNDDCVPHPGCLAAAVAFAHVHVLSLPACRMVDGDGEPLDASYDARPHGGETPWARMFFLRPTVFRSFGPMLDLSWYTDIDYCQRLRDGGHVLRMVDGFTFTHLDPPRTWATPDEVARQYDAYRAVCAAANRSPLI